MKALVYFINMAALLTGCASAVKNMESDSLIPIAEFGRSMAIGLSVNKQNRVFVSFPNYDGNGNLALAELANDSLIPYPSATWNQKGNYSEHFLRVQDLFVDAANRLWVLDSKQNADASSQLKLVCINTSTNQVERVYLFEDLATTKSALNDVRVDTTRNLAYLSDPGQAAIVILDLKTGTTRSVLKNTSVTMADDYTLTYDGIEMKDKDGTRFSSNVNGIALTQDFRYFYFKPINKQELFRISTEHVADSTLTDAALLEKVETMGQVGVTHGLIAGPEGNIYLTSSESYAIKYLKPNGNIQTLVADKRLLWPDSFGIGADGYLYVTCAQLQRLPQWNNGKDKTSYPYRAYKVKLPVITD